MKKLFTTESVSIGHPDKIADSISDFVLTCYLREDWNAKVACETLVTKNKIVLAGEINSKIKVKNLEQHILNFVKGIGYDYKGSGFETKNIEIINLLHEQSNDIFIGVDTGGAGDQGMMFGFACNDNDSYLPNQLCYTHDILKELRTKVNCGYLLPDAKSQITMEYDEDNKPIHIDTILVSQQNSGFLYGKALEQYIKINGIFPVLGNNKLFDDKTKILINPTGKFVIGGPNGDTGLTGRKIIVDTYGGFGYHGGGAFSGKDPSKVDRSGAYMARWLAKNIVYKGYCNSCNVQLAYAIGVAQPVSINVTDKNGKQIDEAIKFCKTIDLTPNGIIKKFSLDNIDYTKYCNYSHFYHKTAPWEII